MTVPAVVRRLALDIVGLISELFVQLRFKAALHELSYRFFEQILDVVHTLDIRC